MQFCDDGQKSCALSTASCTGTGSSVEVEAISTSRFVDNSKNLVAKADDANHSKLFVIA
jgi:hypothetical protein